jgi:hypothetical protein
MNNDQDIVPSKQPGAAEVPQFQTAEFAHEPGTERCRFCGNQIAGEYYRVNGQMACSNCGQQVRDGVPKDSHAAYTRAALFGLGAAVVGSILYGLITTSLNFTIGYFALGVGWMVGAAMKKGSNGMGGRRYQITAALLTYLAISAAGVPILIHEINKDVDQKNQQLAAQAQPGEQVQQVHMNWSKVQGLLIEYAVASPFMELQEGVSGLIGLVILFVGLSIAWRMMAPRPLELDGPYSITAG